MREQLAKIRAEALAAFESVQDAARLDELRVKYLGKKGELTALLKQMGRLTPEERPVMGQLANDVRAALEGALEASSKKLEASALERRLQNEALDVTIPGRAVSIGRQHPMNIALDELKDIFIGMGFQVLDGPEVELAELNFDRLNAGEGHPSRDWSDTFYFDRDSRVTMADLKGTLNTVAEQLFGEGTKTRFRPHHFPFTEPSCEMDVQCHKCGGVGCSTCKGEGWIELLGAGMIHPRVLEMSGIDPEVYSGWAFGFGLERLALRRFKIDDMRLIFENDVRFLEQF